MSFKLALIEQLENRRMFSVTVVDQVLGIEAATAPAQGIVFNANPNLIFTSLPNVVGTYSGTFAIQGAGGGNFNLDITSQNGKILVGSAQVRYLGVTYTIANATAHINLHGTFIVNGSGTFGGIPFSMSAVGHLNSYNTVVRNGGFEFVDPTGATHDGTFALTKTS